MVSFDEEKANPTYKSKGEKWQKCSSAVTSTKILTSLK
jgi:hypothetical protein